MFSKPRLSRFPILWRRFTGAVMGLLLASVVEAQTPAKSTAKGLYTCVDAQGHTVTFD
ncbi:MAG: hypothetical protein ACI9I0_000197 [Rhodoferax sp.]|jgi:hypothetical protein